MMPTFIIIGAPRAGTTSLYYYLRQHPEVVMSRIKETDFFAYLAMLEEKEYDYRPNTPWAVKNLDVYQALFNSTKSNSKAAGEASPIYLCAPGVPKQIKALVPDAKLLLILRNPVDRAYSAFLNNTRQGFESRRFEDAIREETLRPGKVVQSQKYYVRAGMYYHQISRYLEFFDRAQMKIDLYKTLVSQPLSLLEDVFKFIGVAAGFRPDVSVRFNEALAPLVKGSLGRGPLKSFTRRIRDLLPQRLYFSLLNFRNGINRRIAVYPPLPRDMRLFLRDQYIRDVESLGKFLQRDLSGWLDVE